MKRKSISKRFGSIAFIVTFILTFVFLNQRDSVDVADDSVRFVRNDSPHLPTSNPIPFEEKEVENTNENKEDSTHDFHSEIFVSIAEFSHAIRFVAISDLSLKALNSQIPFYLQTHSLRI